MKHFMKSLFAGLSIFIAAFLFTVNTNAAETETIKNLKPGVTYKKYDVTGDQKADKVNIQKIKGDSDSYSGLKIRINGRTAYQLSKSFYYDAAIKICTLKNHKVFFYINLVADNDNGPVCGVFRYTGGKLKQVINFQTLYKDGAHQSGAVLKVKGNQLTVKGYAMSWAMGGFEYQYTYKYKKGSLARTSTVGKITKTALTWQNKTWFTANQSIGLYKKVSSSKKYTTLKKGTKMKVSGCYISGKKILLKVRTSGGKTGWIKSPRRPLDNGQGLFKESYYAG